jgi:hypothetical protein
VIRVEISSATSTFTASEEGIESTISKELAKISAQI